MPTRFFVDENDLALGKALTAEHSDVVYPGHPDLPDVPRGSRDEEWLRVVGNRRLIVITRDKRIRYRAAEKQAWVDHQVRGFVLTGTKSQTTADSKALLNMYWQRILIIVTEGSDGPWMRSVTRGEIRTIDLS